MMRFRVRGVDEMRGRLRDVAQRFPIRVAEAMYEEAKVELAESNRRVPVLTGFLQGSGHVNRPEMTGNGIRVLIIYDAPYSLYVHEDLEAHHTNGQAKFLSSTLNESAPFMAQRIIARIELGSL